VRGNAVRARPAVIGFREGVRLPTRLGTASRECHRKSDRARGRAFGSAHSSRRRRVSPSREPAHDLASERSHPAACQRSTPADAMGPMQEAEVEEKERWPLARSRRRSDPRWCPRPERDRVPRVAAEEAPAEPDRASVRAPEPPRGERQRRPLQERVGSSRPRPLCGAHRPLARTTNSLFPRSRPYRPFVRLPKPGHTCQR
jgi:hypothetical protein